MATLVYRTLFLIVANFFLVAMLMSEEATIIGGKYKQTFGFDTTTITINSFSMDINLVTNKQYLEFVKNNPNWQKSKIKGIFADKNYLRNWENDTVLGLKIEEDAPVTYISWFAAKNYCSCIGKRLATNNEWEFAADYLQYRYLNISDSSFHSLILSWYGKAGNGKINKVGNVFVNQYGVQDLHGLVFEWIYDFSATLISGESRKDGSLDRNLFCASGSQIGLNLKDYAAFMRYSLRGSLKSNFTINNLGFRCVRNQK